MKYFVIILTLLIFLGNSIAETKPDRYRQFLDERLKGPDSEILKLIAEKLHLEGPDNLIVGQKTIDYRNTFMNKHENLFNSLGKEEIFYHLDLAYILSRNRPGSQPHAVYAVYLYAKFYSDYTKEENELISERFEAFFERGWIRKQDMEAFQAAKNEGEHGGAFSNRGKARLNESDAESSIVATQAIEANQVAVSEPAIEEPAEAVIAESIEEDVEQSSNSWLWLVGAVIVVGGVLMLCYRRGNSRQP